MARFREGKEWFIISFRSKVGRSAGDREVEEIESWGGGGKELYAELSVQSTSERNGAAITVPRSPASD